MNRIFFAIGLGAIALMGSSCSVRQPATPAPVVQEDIVYGMNQDSTYIEQSREDCEQRGGSFNQCGSACQPGETCIAVCVLKCEFSDSL